jgi:hypothetical protein
MRFSRLSIIVIRDNNAPFANRLSDPTPLTIQGSMNSGTLGRSGIGASNKRPRDKDDEDEGEDEEEGETRESIYPNSPFLDDV